VPLVVSSIIRKGWSFRSDVSSICVLVDKKYLSEQYELKYFIEVYWVYGSIIDVVNVHKPLTSIEKEVFEKHVIGRNIKLYLVPGFFTAYDTLYFDNNSWSILRDVGVFPDDYKVKLKLVRVEIQGVTGVRELELYPYRDIETPEV